VSTLTPAAACDPGHIPADLAALVFRIPSNEKVKIMRDECQTMRDVARFRDEAARAERWARAIPDTRMVERLLDVASEYRRRAEDLQRALPTA
jgi:hypothetical protein